MSTVVTAPQPQPVVQADPYPNQLGARRPRLCGLCRCPGHTRGRCPVIEVNPPHWFSDFGNVDAELNGQVNAMVRDIMEKSRKGIPRIMFRDHYLRTKGYNPEDFRRYTGYKYYTPSPTAKQLLTHKITILQNLGPGESMDRVWALPEEYRSDISLEARPLQVSDLSTAPRLAAPRLQPSVPPAPAQPQPSAPPAPAPTHTVVPPPVPELVVKDKVIEDTTCPICMEDLTECNKTVAACGHQFHASCMMTWVRQPRSTCKNCPTCRAPMFQ